MDEGWIQSDDAKNLYREVRGTYEYDATTKKFVFTDGIELNYYEILLTQEKIAIVMASDFDRIKRNRWHAYTHGYTYYARAVIDGTNVGMHRFLTNNQYDIVDHIDGNGLFNISANLRDGANSINQRNQINATGAYYDESRDCYVGKYYEYNGQQKNERFYVRDYLLESDAERAASEWARSNNERVLKQIQQNGRCPEEKKRTIVKQTSNSGYKHIVHDINNKRYRVQIDRSGKRYLEGFTYATISQESALEDAIKHRDEFLEANPPSKRGRKQKQKTE